MNLTVEPMNLTVLQMNNVIMLTSVGKNGNYVTLENSILIMYYNTKDKKEQILYSNKCVSHRGIRNSETIFCVYWDWTSK